MEAIDEARSSDEDGQHENHDKLIQTDINLAKKNDHENKKIQPIM